MEGGGQAHGTLIDVVFLDILVNGMTPMNLGLTQGNDAHTA